MSVKSNWSFIKISRDGYLYNIACLKITPGISYENFFAGGRLIGERSRREIRRTKHAALGKKKAEERDDREVVRSGPKGREREEVTSRESNEPRLAAIRRPNRVILMNSSH